MSDNTADFLRLGVPCSTSSSKEETKRRSEENHSFAHLFDKPEGITSLPANSAYIPPEPISKPTERSCGIDLLVDYVWYGALYRERPLLCLSIWAIFFVVGSISRAGAIRRLAVLYVIKEKRRGKVWRWWFEGMYGLVLMKNLDMLV